MVSHAQTRDSAAQLADQIRRLARMAHQFKAEPSVDPVRGERLIGEIDGLLERLQGRRQQPLRRWALALRREVLLGLEPVAQG